MRTVALTIAGSDPSGGAGIQADLKTFHQHGVYGTAALTLLTVQNTVGVTRVEVMSPELVVQQLDAVVSDLSPRAAKTGALGSLENIERLADRLAQLPELPLVIDPVMVSKHGASLMAADARAAFRRALLPLATVLTPNAPEASELLGRPVETLPQARDAARALHDLGARSVLLKGGHLAGDATDLLWHDGALHELPAPRVATQHTHGTGCSYSAAITARLACGEPVLLAVQQAKRWIHEAIATAPGLGHGHGPVNHFAPVPRDSDVR